MKQTYLAFIWTFVIFASCQNNNHPVSDIYKDFPEAETLDFKPSHSYIADYMESSCYIRDSTFWVFRDTDNNIGSCYNAHTGKKYSSVAAKGNLQNQIQDLEGFHICDNSVFIRTDYKTIKIFSKKDILNDTPLEERECSVTQIPDSLYISQAIPLADGYFLATLRPALFKHEKVKNCDNSNSVTLFNSQAVRYFQTIDHSSFNIGKASPNETKAKNLIQWAYAQGNIKAKDNNIAVFTVNDQFILYTLDLKTGNVLHEKRYTEIQRDGNTMSFSTTNFLKLRIRHIATNARYIACQIEGYFNKEDVKANTFKQAICIFDWNLQPLKRIDLPTDTRDNYFSHYQIADDCSAIYFLKFNEESHYLKTFKADLNL